MIAALYVATNGIYANRVDVDAWDEARDARKYAGPWPVVAHPPCSRWCRLAGLVEARWGHKRGDDGGCFAAALAAVRKWGGVIEHPAYSDAFAAHGLGSPPPSRWMAARAVRWMGLPRRAGALRAPREESHVALRVRHRRPPCASVGLERRHSLNGAGVVVRQPRAQRKDPTARGQGRRFRHTTRLR